MAVTFKTLPRVLETRNPIFPTQQNRTEQILRPSSRQRLQLGNIGKKRKEEENKTRKKRTDTRQEKKTDTNKTGKKDRHKQGKKDRHKTREKDKKKKTEQDMD